MSEERTIHKVKPNRIIRWPEVMDRTGLSRSHIHALQKRGLFPLQLKLVPGGRASGFAESEIDQYIQSRIDAERGIY